MYLQQQKVSKKLIQEETKRKKTMRNDPNFDGVGKLLTCHE